MKFLRVGELGKETPAVLDNDNKIRDLSKIIQDFNPNNLKTNRENYVILKELDVFERIYRKT